MLANEQVVGGLCERCKSEVTKRKLNQWYFKITDYAEQLLDDMAQLEGGWPDHVLAMQRNWIGRSEGAHVEFAVEGREEPITVFTTRPDTLFGATFMVVAPDGDLAAELVSDEQRPAFEAYLEQVKRTTEIERQSTEHEKTGVWHAISGVNVTLGLPILRTSVDHGTAFDIAGKGIANADSLVDAVEYAVKLLEGQRNKRESQS